jgi:hypothetical protein
MRISLRVHVYLLTLSLSLSPEMTTKKVLIAILMMFAVLALAAKEDPKECEVCMEVMEGVDALVPVDEKKSKTSIEEAVSSYCKNKELTAKQKKMCYYIEPIKKSVSQPFSLRLPKKKVSPSSEAFVMF